VSGVERFPSPRKGTLAVEGAPPVRHSAHYARRMPRVSRAKRG